MVGRIAGIALLLGMPGVALGSAPGRLCGRILMGGGPPIQATAWEFRLSRPGSTRRFHCDAEGRFKVDGLRPGAWILEVCLPDAPEAWALIPDPKRTPERAQAAGPEARQWTIRIRPGGTVHPVLHAVAVGVLEQAP
ncbi:MAG TPA: hypothetical protein VJ600_07695, partial [Holophagaceae bacterium]|nr:hypothetical protein [Holophagaceae bacterium]